MKVGEFVEVTVRPMEMRDISQIVAIENCSFPTPWRCYAFVNELRNKFAVYFVALNYEQVVGYAGMWLFPGEAHVTTIAVHPSYRGKRLGKLLMNTLIENATAYGAQTMVLEVRPSNVKAINLYRGLGFRQIGLRRNYYMETQEDALVMLKSLQQARNYSLAKE